jgi:uncharacterized membrane protein YqaE (UPF0057 family)
MFFSFFLPFLSVFVRVLRARGVVAGRGQERS